MSAARASVDLVVTLTEITCGECGAVYAIAECYRRQTAEKGGFWTCPYCKTGWGYTKSELERERERHRETLARLNEANAERDKLQRKVARVEQGVCPHCNRTFKNLQRHMRCKHTESAS